MDKRCSRCGEYKSKDSLAKNRAHEDGVASYCRSCQSAYMKEYHKNHREHQLARMREYSKSHYEQRNERRNRRYAEDEAHRKRVREKARTYCKTWVQAHPGEVAQCRKRRRARKANAEGFHTFQEWIDLCKREGWLCSLCAAQLTALTATADHIVPLSRGGSDYISNIQLACRSCNSRKGTKLPEGMEIK